MENTNSIENYEDVMYYEDSEFNYDDYGDYPSRAVAWWENQEINLYPEADSFNEWEFVDIVETMFDSQALEVLDNEP